MRSRPGATGTPIEPPRRALLRRGGLLTLAALGLGSGAAHAARLALGQPAPPLVLHTLDGHSIATTSLTGQVVILTFWATWCEPCRVELPMLSRFAARHASHGLTVLGFSLDGAEDLNDVKTIASQLSFPVGLLGSAYAGDYGRVWHLPVNFTIDRHGRLADNGWDDEVPTWTEERLERIVVPLLSSV